MFKKKCNSFTCCCENPALGLGMLRLGVVLLFLGAGVLKIMNPAIIQGLIQNQIGVTGTLGIVLAWIVTVTEVGGSILVFLGKLVPKILYKLSLLGFLIILVVVMLTIYIPRHDPMSILSHVLMITSVLCLLFTKPMCPQGIFGDKE